MMLIRHLLPLSTVISVSVSVYIPDSLRQQDHAKSSYRHDLDSVPSVQSSRRMQWFAVTTIPDAKGVVPWKDGALLKRSEDNESSDAPNEVVNLKLESGAGTPQLHEAEELLSPEELKRYHEAWEGRKSYERARYAVRKAERKGLEPPPEAVELQEISKPKAAAYIRLKRLIENRLVESGKARPATTAQLKKAAERDAKYKRSRREKLKALGARIKSGEATEQDRKDWSAVLAKRRAKAQLANDLYHAEKAKAKEARARIEADQGTEEDHNVWNEWETRRQIQLERMKLQREKQKSKKATPGTEAEETRDFSEDGSTSSKDTTTSEFESKGVVDHFKHQPLQSAGNAVLHGSGHLLEKLRDQWQDVLRNTNRPTYLPPAMRGIPLKIFL